MLLSGRLPGESEVDVMGFAVPRVCESKVSCYPIAQVAALDDFSGD
jgi:hypothetical protein